MGDNVANCIILQRGWEQASLFIASVIICFSAVNGISYTVNFVTLKRLVFFRGWVQYRIGCNFRKSTLVINLKVQRLF